MCGIMAWAFALTSVFTVLLHSNFLSVRYVCLIAVFHPCQPSQYHLRDHFIIDFSVIILLFISFFSFHPLRFHHPRTSSHHRYILSSTLQVMCCCCLAITPHILLWNCILYICVFIFGRMFMYISACLHATHLFVFL